MQCAADDIVCVIPIIHRPAWTSRQAVFRQPEVICSFKDAEHFATRLHSAPACPDDGWRRAGTLTERCRAVLARAGAGTGVGCIDCTGLQEMCRVWVQASCGVVLAPSFVGLVEARYRYGRWKIGQALARTCHRGTPQRPKYASREIVQYIHQVESLDNVSG